MPTTARASRASEYCCGVIRAVTSELPVPRRLRLLGGDLAGLGLVARRDGEHRAGREVLGRWLPVRGLGDVDADECDVLDVDGLDVASEAHVAHELEDAPAVEAAGRGRAEDAAFGVGDVDLVVGDGWGSHGWAPVVGPR